MDDANRPDSPLRVQAVEIPAEDLQRRSVTVESHSILAERLGVAGAAAPAASKVSPLRRRSSRRPKSAPWRRQPCRRLTRCRIVPSDLPGAALLRRPDIQARVVEAVKASYQQQLTLEGVREPVDVEQVVATVCAEVADATIDIPRVLVVPIGKVESGFSPFTLDLSSVQYQSVTEDLWIQHLRTAEYQVLSTGAGGIREERLENYVVRGLVDFDDVSYDEQADLLYDLAGQVVSHLRSYLTEEETGKVLQFHQRALCALIHAQMHEPGHYWERAEGGYEVKVSHGFTTLRRSAYTADAGDPVHDYRVEPADKTKIARMLFGGFAKCLYRVQKFQSDTERRFAVILERDRHSLAQAGQRAVPDLLPRRLSPAAVRARLRRGDRHRAADDRNEGPERDGDAGGRREASGRRGVVRQRVGACGHVRWQAVAVRAGAA